MTPEIIYVKLFTMLDVYLKTKLRFTKTTENQQI